jgi:hypothetical protein
MIGNIVTDEEGNPLDNGGNKLSPSSLVIPLHVRKFFLQFQTDYTTNWSLQHKPLDEFDGLGLLDRAKLDQETFAAFVGIEYLPKHKKWRWRGRKNTARNKLIGIAAHLITGMLFPYVFAQNERDEEDKITARVMAIMVEENLKKAGYEIKFLYLVLSALVNPAVFVHVEHIQALQKIKQRKKDGTIDIKQVVDEAISGLFLNILPIDEILLGDLYSGTGNIHMQPNIFRVRRVSYDYARSVYAGRFFDANGKDLFDFVQAGQTRWIQSNEENTLFDVETSEADRNFVQIATGYYRSEDLQVPFVGGIPMCNWDNIYNNNPFEHRRMTLQNDEWYSVPIYPFAMSGFEPIDPTGRFAYYKSGAFKEYWEDRKITEIDRLVVDGVKLDVIKPTFISGATKFDSQVMVPGATIAVPKDANIQSYSMGPNLAAAYKAIVDAEKDMSASTQSGARGGVADPNVTATADIIAAREARIFIQVFGLMNADLVKQIGQLSTDVTIQFSTIGELDSTVPESLRMKFKIFTAKGKDRGKNVTNRIVFTDKMMGKRITKEEKARREWKLFDKAGGEKTDQRIWEVNPFKFARTRFSMVVDADKIISRSMGTDRQEKDIAFQRLMDPRVLPFIDPEAVANDFVIEEYATGDPDRYKSKKGQEEMLAALMSVAEKSNPPTKQLPEQIESKI